MTTKTLTIQLPESIFRQFAQIADQTHQSKPLLSRVLLNTRVHFSGLESLARALATGG